MPYSRVPDIFIHVFAGLAFLNLPPDVDEKSAGKTAR
jgi:hypothetical protein